MFEELKETDDKKLAYKTGLKRLKEREDAYIRVNHKEFEGKTQKQIVSKRKHEMHENNV